MGVDLPSDPENFISGHMELVLCYVALEGDGISGSGDLPTTITAKECRCTQETGWDVLFSML